MVRGLGINEFVLRQVTSRTTEEGNDYNTLRPTFAKDLTERDKPREWKDPRGRRGPRGGDRDRGGAPAVIVEIAVVNGAKEDISTTKSAIETRLLHQVQERLHQQHKTPTAELVKVPLQEENRYESYFTRKLYELG